MTNRVPAIVIRDADPQGSHAETLLREASAEMRVLYPELFVGVTQQPTNAALGERSRFLVALVDDRLAGCAALRPLSPEMGEIKRMFVRRDFRRGGVARALLEQLLRDAVTFGYRQVVLETGNKQVPAMRLYETCGFARVAPFGPYANDPTSVCYRRLLAAG